MTFRFVLLSRAGTDPIFLFDYSMDELCSIAHRTRWSKSRKWGRWKYSNEEIKYILYQVWRFSSPPPLRIRREANQMESGSFGIIIIIYERGNVPFTTSRTVWVCSGTGSIDNFYLKPFENGKGIMNGNRLTVYSVQSRSWKEISNLIHLLFPWKSLHHKGIAGWMERS